jgi:FAD:protein FMN transferase
MTGETVQRFACFGGACEVRVSGAAGDAAARARERLHELHERFTRFAPGSELSRLNSDAREEVPVGATMAALADAIVAAARRTGGVVDGTLAREIEAAGYRRAPARPLPLALALRLAPPRQPAGPCPDADRRTLVVDRERGTVRRPPAVAIDGGGLAKGLFADLVAGDLAGYDGVVVNCAGDLRLAGAQPRPVRVASPFGEEILHTFRLRSCGVATSGIGRRSWLGANGRPAHHLLDPATGEPAFTGVVQVTALAPTALEAEVLAKAALLSGPRGAAGWLPHGGVIVLDDGSHRVLDGSQSALSVLPRSSDVRARC